MALANGYAVSRIGAVAVWLFGGFGLGIGIIRGDFRIGVNRIFSIIRLVVAKHLAELEGIFQAQLGNPVVVLEHMHGQFDPIRLVGHILVLNTQVIADVQ